MRNVAAGSAVQAQFETDKYVVNGPSGATEARFSFATACVFYCDWKQQSRGAPYIYTLFFIYFTPVGFLNLTFLY